MDCVTYGDCDSVAYDNRIRVGQVDNGIGKGVRIFERSLVDEHYGVVVPQVHVFLDGRLPGTVYQGRRAQD